MTLQDILLNSSILHVHALVLTLLVRSNNHLQLERAAAAAAAAHISSSSSGLNSSSSSSNTDPKCLLLKSKALHVPPLPPDFGRTRTSFSTAIPTAGGGSRPSEWRPKQGVLVASLREHTAAVNRLAVTQDQSFFASASSDGTCKIWELRGIEQSIRPQSRITYSAQGGQLTDVCAVDGTHSLATASTNGRTSSINTTLANYDMTTSLYRGITPSGGGGVPSELSSAHTDSSAASSGGVSGASLIRQ
eukprot:20692-Heterococcus_DN1.PRE.1